MGSENPKFNRNPEAAEALPDSELAQFWAALNEEEKLRVNMDEPGMIVIYTRDGRLLDKLRRVRFIEGQTEDEKELRISTTDHALQLLKMPDPVRKEPK